MLILVRSIKAAVTRGGSGQILWRERIMRNKKAILFFVVAVLFAAAASVGAHRLITEQARIAASKKLTTVPVVVAATDIEAGTLLTENFVGIQEWPKNNLPAGYYSKIDNIKNRVTLSPMVKGEVILGGKLAARGAKGGLSSLILPGMRAITVHVDEVIGVAGFLKPGDHVDVVVSMSSSQFSNNPASKVVLQDVEVLAIGEKTVEEDAPDDNNAKKRKKTDKVTVVTLQMTPADSERLALASHNGSVLLTLRNQGDRIENITGGIYLTSIMPTPKEEPKPAPAPPKKTVTKENTSKVEVIKGSTLNIVEFKE